MTDLTDLWLRLPGVDPVDLDRHGISFRASQIVGGLRWARVRYEKGGRFDLDPDGEAAVLIGAWEDPPSLWRDVPDPLLIDIVAVDPARPRRSATYCGGAGLLGEAVLAEAQFYRCPLPVYRDPVIWLLNEGAGVVPLDARLFALAVIGDAKLEIVGEDLDHTKQLKRMVQAAARLDMPRFRVAA